MIPEFQVNHQVQHQQELAYRGPQHPQHQGQHPAHPGLEQGQPHKGGQDPRQKVHHRVGDHRNHQPNGRQKTTPQPLVAGKAETQEKENHQVDGKEQKVLPKMQMTLIHGHTQSRKKGKDSSLGKGTPSPCPPKKGNFQYSTPCTLRQNCRKIAKRQS